MQAIRCGTFLHRSYNWAKGKSKNHRFLAAFFSIFLSPLKEIWPPEAYMRKQNIGGGRGRTPPLRRIRREYTGIRWCADAGRRGRRPLRRDRRKCAGIRRCADAGRRGRRPLRRDRRKCAGIRRCADAGRRGRRPLRRDRRKCAGIRRCADAGRRGRRPLRGARPETWRDTCGRGVPIGAFKRGTQERQRR